MKDNKKQNISGQLLLADYQTAFVSMATVETAKFEAERSENTLLAQLSTIGSGQYLNPGSISSDLQTNVTRASLDAHIKKVQAEQLKSIGTLELLRLTEQDQADYKKRKVRINILPGQDSPLDSVWFNNQTGYRTSTLKRKAVVGTIEEVALDKNVLVLKPNLTMRLINPELKSYLVYIIDPATLKPMVDITLI